MRTEPEEINILLQEEAAKLKLAKVNIMNSEIKMSVSSLTKTEDKKGVYVLFTDGDKSAEFVVPGCKVINNRGFDEEEIKQLRDYVDSEQDYIFSLAKEVNPIKAFMGR